MPKPSLRIGQLVCSKAGRDTDKFYIVVRVLDESFVEVVDGDQRGWQNPKKKNVKHLMGFDSFASLLTEQDKPHQVNDDEIRQVIMELTSRI